MAAARRPIFWFPPDQLYPRYLTVPGASDVPVFADSPWVGSWPDNNDFVPTDLTIGFTPHATGYFMGRFCVARHGIAVNVVFADGHVWRTPLAELWQLQWHLGSVPKVVHVP